MFKSLQVLRTASATVSLKGLKVPEGTRVVVVNYKSDGPGAETIVARVQDPSFPDLAKARVVLTPAQVAQTHRGRPTVTK